jgi:hypothetical protein
MTAGIRPFVTLLLGLGLSYASRVGAQAPTDLQTCGLGCSEGLPGSFIFLNCPGFPSATFAIAMGRHWWGPLTCVGPVQVSLQVLPWGPPAETLPIILEVRRDSSAGGCRASTVGQYLWRIDGGGYNCHPDSLWVRSPLLDLPGIIGMGTEYWLQLQGFGRIDEQGDITAVSPYLSCVRLEAFPTSLVATRWSSIKALYR